MNPRPIGHTDALISSFFGLYRIFSSYLCHLTEVWQAAICFACVLLASHYTLIGRKSIRFGNGELHCRAAFGFMDMNLKLSDIQRFELKNRRFYDELTVFYGKDEKVTLFPEEPVELMKVLEKPTGCNTALT